MKKILPVLSILTVLTLFLVGCGGNDEAPVAGTWNDGVFVNESLGLQFQLPRGWDPLVGDEIANLLGAGAFVLDQMDGVSTADLLEEMERNPLHDMVAMDMSSGSMVQIMYQRLPRSASRYTSERALQEIIGDDAATAFGMELTPLSSSVYIGENAFYGATGTMDVMGLQISLSLFVNLQGRNATVIMMSDMGIFEDLDEMLVFFNTPGAELIYQPEPAAVEAADLLGVWAWNVDNEYVLIFNADGTGARGYVIIDEEAFLDDLEEELGTDVFDALVDEVGGVRNLLELMIEEFEELGMSESFEWELANGVLHIDFETVGSFGLANEEWIATIDGNRLDIESRQVPGVSYSYIRQ